MVVGINCGHAVSGTVGSGAVGYINESNETRRVGYALMSYLKEKGVQVVDCTNDYANTVSENLAQIVAMANAAPLDLFVSVHFNSGGGKGVEVYTYNGEKFLQAVDVCKNLAGLGFVDRGVKDGSGLYVIRRSTAKSMLVEVCFVDTESDVNLYKEVGVDRIAQAIGDAILGKDEEELTMTQYEELKNRLDKLENPMIYNYIDDNMPSWARDAVKWCVDNSIIVGTGDGLNLDNMKLWTCTVIYRLAQDLQG